MKKNIFLINTIALLSIVMLSCQHPKKSIQVTTKVPSHEIADPAASYDQQLASLTSIALTTKINENLSEANLPQNTFQVKAIVFKEEEKKTLAGQEQRAMKFDFVIEYLEDYSEKSKKGSEEKGHGSIVFIYDGGGSWLHDEVIFLFE